MKSKLDMTVLQMMWIELRTLEKHDPSVRKRKGKEKL